MTFPAYSELAYLAVTAVMRALLGEVFPSLRAVIARWSEPEKRMIVFAIVDSDVGEDDEESLSCIHTGVIADMPEDWYVEITSAVVPSGQKITEEGVWVFARRE